MKIDRLKLNIELATQCKTISSLRPKVSPKTIKKITDGCSVRPDVVGRVAQALNVDVTDIIAEHNA